MLPKRDLDFVRRDPETPKTQLVIVVGLLLISVLFSNEVIRYVALATGLIALIIPAAGHLIVWGWYRLALILSRVVNPVVLGLLFYLFITPIALLFRLSGNDPMRLKDNRGSMYEQREHTYTAQDLKNPW
jgi:hypothetical protein